MTHRTRDTWLLIAGLPGVVALFLPVTELIGHLVPAQYLWRGLAVLDVETLRSPFFWDVLPVALPIPVTILQLARHRPGVHSRGAMILAMVIVTFFAATHLAWMAGVLWSLVTGLDRTSLEALALLCVAAANVGLLYHNLRRRRPLALTTEVLMLGTYIAVVTLWLTIFLSLNEHFLAPKLMAWTCLVYLVTIFVRMRDRAAPPPDESAPG